MISAEISQVQSWQQDNEGVLLQNGTDVATLEDQANQTSYQIDLFDSLLVDLAEITINCGTEVKLKFKIIQINIYISPKGHANICDGVLQLHL